MNKIFVVMVVAAIGVVVGGCGKLTNSKAEQLVREKWFGDNDDLTCEWAETLQALPGGRYSLFVPPKGGAGCTKALIDVGALKTASGTSLELGAKAKVDGVHVTFPCGKRVFKAITSIVTEGNAATIKYTRLVVTNKAVMAKVSACTLQDPPTDGEAERELKVVKDDSGTWRTK